ncbi:MAG TPA: glycosyl hydrolase-related protein, partial [Streptomyces sp.]
APGSATVAPLVAVDDEGVVVEAVKLADDESGDVVVRLFESRGTRARAVLTAGFPLAGATVTDLLERPLEGESVDVAGDEVRFALRPFQILTLRLARQR